MPNPSQKSLHALDALNLFLADVRDGVGPYLSVYLKSSQQWNPAEIGVAISASAIATVVAQTPVGALVDRLRYKRLMIGIAAIFVSIGCVSIVLFPSFPVTIGAQILIGLAAAVFPPAIAALTLGPVGRNKLDRRIGRNETFNHAGNFLAAGSAGLIGQFINQKGIFYLVAVMAIGSGFAVARIREREIDHELARGGEEEGQTPASTGNPVQRMLRILRDRRIRMFALSVVLFHFANAAMLPLVGQRLASGNGLDPTVYMSACIIVAQLVMIPTANLTGRLSQAGRKPLFLLGFAVLPIRGVLYTLSDNPYFLVSVQVLDGIAGGIFGVLSILVVADLTKGTGQFNVTQGMLNTAIGIGAGLSNLIAGVIVQKAGYNAGFRFLATIAIVATVTFWLTVPETKSPSEHRAPAAL